MRTCAARAKLRSMLRPEPGRRGTLAGRKLQRQLECRPVASRACNWRGLALGQQRTLEIARGFAAT